MTANDKPLPISVCTLVMNEEENLPRCLDQISNFAEWIVLDTGSTDDSTRLAAKLGARVESGIWEGFSLTRRRLFSMGSQPWNLWIDADEVITPDLVEELRLLFADGPDLPHAANQINRLTCFEGQWIRHGDWYPDWVTRLFRADAWDMPERAVHESLNIDGSIGRLSSTLPHYSYKDRADREARIATYTQLWAEQEAARGRRVGPATPFLHAMWKYVRGLLLKLGILDGGAGCFIAWSNAVEVYRKYRLLRQLGSRPD